MSNKRWMEKLLKWNPEDKKEEVINISKGKRYCEGFEKEEHGLCKHYMGCKVGSKTCADECSYK